MKKKIIWSVGIVLVVVIIGYVFVSLSSSKSSPSLASLSNIKPMYGASSYEEYVAFRTAAIQKADEDFIKSIADGKFSKKDAFQEVIKLAWDYLGQKDTDTAMKRCNQAWLIDHTNFNTYWCMAGILDAKHDLEQAAVYADKALLAYSPDAELFKNDYLPLYKDSSKTFINLSDKYLTTDQASAKKYASKAVDLLSRSLNDKNLPTGIVPEEMGMLATAYFNNFEYAKARSKYDELIKKYPDYSKNPNLTGFSEALKAKGF